MSCPNFERDSCLGLVVLPTDDIKTTDIDEYYLIEEDIFNTLSWEFDHFNENLEVLKLGFKSGNYDGASVCIEYPRSDMEYEYALIINSRKDKKLLKNTLKEIDNDYWCIDEKAVIKDYKKIVKYINKKITNGELKSLSCDDIFSNGEAVYSISNKLLEA